MHRKREDLDILFRMTTPEMILESIRKIGRKPIGGESCIRIRHYPKMAYEHFAMWVYKECSPDDIDEQFKILQLSDERFGSDGGIFTTLFQFAEQVLCLESREPICRLEQALNFNSIAKRLGQDLFVTCWLAGEDLIKERQGDWDFTWPAALRTDDRRLKSLLRQGVAENHFHLNGSTQNFPLSWACLMNHPQFIVEYLREKDRFKENLNVRMSRGVVDNVMGWDKRLRYAAAIRALLSMRILRKIGCEETADYFGKIDWMPLGIKMDWMVQALRRTEGVYLPQRDGKRKCLDYAMNGRFYKVDISNHNRLLAGERSFLYHCFREQFMGEFSELESMLFYLYISIKSNFRSEMIQNNGRPGFKNFADYQDRKSQCFDKLPEYNEEAYRLAIVSPMKTGNVGSLEARIMPGRSVNAMRNTIANIDKSIQYAVKREPGMGAVGGDGCLNYFYVIHFPKKKFYIKECEEKPCVLRPRNYETRNMAYRRAHVLNRYMTKGDKTWEADVRLGQRIYGIDACSREIGCRPETFATEFRYLQRCSGNVMRGFPYDCCTGAFADMGVTYHVGEDFLDILDGLRAVDEAVHFLQMQKNSRLGHAIVLGIDATEYYQRKRFGICLSKQDLLDNLVWLLYRSLELNVKLETSSRELVRNKAQELLYEIYHRGQKGDMYPSESLDCYYYSWKLRGDHPSLYRSGIYKETWSFYDRTYEEAKIGDSSLQVYRNLEQVAGYVSQYHYSYDVKIRGDVAECLDLRNWPWYSAIVADMQKGMRFEIAQRGIAVECNPTSNVLISTFGSYDRHPILVFNQYGLDTERKAPNLTVSLNTDDLGVFDTTLENEYALMLCAILQVRHANGDYNDDIVYDYLNHLRENGFRMAFKSRS